MTGIEHGRDSAPKNPRPAFAQPRLILYVLLGGAVGTGLREGLALAMPADGGVPWSVLIVNLAGAFILGFLLTALAARKPETPGLRDFRLFAGTGMMGGLTTYSSLATDTATLYETDAVVATLYGLGSVIVGFLAAFLGVILAGALHRPSSADEAKS